MTERDEQPDTRHSGRKYQDMGPGTCFECMRDWMDSQSSRYIQDDILRMGFQDTPEDIGKRRYCFVRDKWHSIHKDLAYMV